jgi:uncharacterized protein
MERDESNSLCLECGLCCNGVIFANLQLRPGDDTTRLEKLFAAATGKIETLRANSKLPQPCPALDGCVCRVYAGRPQYCRQFDCLLLKSVKAGKTPVTSALRTVKSAVRRAEKVRGLLRQLGDRDEQRALSLRFRRIKKCAETGELDGEAAGLFGELTLAMHNLNVLLSEEFYPGA